MSENAWPSADRIKKVSGELKINRVFLDPKMDYLISFVVEMIDEKQQLFYFQGNQYVFNLRTDSLIDIPHIADTHKQVYPPLS